ncbi:GNAT family N-acetyltransferase [Oryzobacter terrae]|uniref:GNAT family N-acetyltransferase n=1 Tax=Oryzobacter terrae TaxID=1620385 RepID=UPI00366BADEC
MIRLVRPTTRLQRSYLEASAEFGGAHRDGDGDLVEEADDGFPGVAFTRANLETEEGFARFVARRLEQAEEDAPRPEGRVPCTFLWVVDDTDPDTYLGSLAVRHRLTPYLTEAGGHIGYSVRPSARNAGVATAALREGLVEAGRIGIDPVLLTCDVDNATSAGVIERNGGVLEDVRGSSRRYWVPVPVPDTVPADAD